MTSYRFTVVVQLYVYTILLVAGNGYSTSPVPSGKSKESHLLTSAQLQNQAEAVQDG